MNVSKEDLDRAVAQQIITSEQARFLWLFLHQSGNSSSSGQHFNLVTVFHYLGTVIVLLAMVWLGSIWQSQLGPFSLFWIASLYGAIFLTVGYKLWQSSSYRTAGGLLLTLAVCMVPFLVYGLENGWELRPISLEGNQENQLVLAYEWQLNWNQVAVDLTTMLAASCLLLFVRFPLLTVPLYLSFWLLILDSFPLVFYSHLFTWHDYQLLSLGVGIFILCISFWLDRRAKEDFALYSYFIGLLAFWIALTALAQGSSQWLKAVYCFINIGFLLLAVLLNRKIFLFFGVLGIFGYLCYLAYSVFADSSLFPFILSLLGLGTLYLGVLFQKYQLYWKLVLIRYLPQKYQKIFSSSDC